MFLLAKGFLWFPWLSHGYFTHQNVHLVHGLVVFFIILLLALLFKYSLKSIDSEILSDGQPSIKNLFQVLVESLLNLMRGIIPHHTEDYFPLVGSIFIYIFLSNLLGLVPGLLPPTENLNTNLAVGISVFVYYNYIGIKRQGVKHYMAHFFGPNLGDSIGMILLRVGFLAPLMFVIELISHSVRPVSLALRLYGNINGDHMVLSTFADLAPFVVPIIFLAFGIFVSFIQAFVFTLLSTIYMGLAVATHEPHRDSH